ncbi:MAG: hypothetical protein HOP16_07930 [Acidobacteria bacterium]|nr:hypothetical protein [Acidobacteriota bacterium]
MKTNGGFAVRFIILSVCVAFSALVGERTVAAHHAGTMFSEDVKEISGVIKEFQFTNPHTWIQVMVETKAGAPQQEWSVEWGSPNQLGRRGVRPSTFKPGAKVTMRINPMRDGSPAAGFVGAKFADGTTVGDWK